MLRYRVLPPDFDSTPGFLAEQPPTDRAAATKWQEDRAQILKGLGSRYGEWQFESKIQNLIDLGPKPMSVAGFHNRFLEEVRVAFVVGAYYPAVTAACALGERMLNHLVRRLRQFYRGTPAYGKVAKKDSFDNWRIPLNALAEWRVLVPGVLEMFSRLEAMRHNAIHFREELDVDPRPAALDAIHQLQEIIVRQFGVTSGQPWLFYDVPGEFYVRKRAEVQPFVRLIYLPDAFLVGPEHRLEYDGQWFRPIDHGRYRRQQITDREWVGLRRASLSHRTTKVKGGE